jgi:transposase
MHEITRIAIDTSKNVFTLHGVDAEGRQVLRRNLRRAGMERFFEKHPPVEVVMEACAGSHHWGRWLGERGHRVRLLPAHYVKPFVKRGKNDRNDAEAIAVAAAQPSIREVPVKSLGMQAEAMLLSVRELLVRQRTQLVNALRGHATELGLVAPAGDKGLTQLQSEIAGAEETVVPEAAKQALAMLGAEICRLEARLAVIDGRLKRQLANTPLAKRLAAVPGIGPIGALNLALRVDASAFSSGRHFAAWLGLAPRENSTGGKQRLGGISRAGNKGLRQLLVLGATAVVRHTARPGRAGPSPWLQELLKRRPRKVAATAWANKMARIVWAMMARDQPYRPVRAAA